MAQSTVKEKGRELVESLDDDASWKTSRIWYICSGPLRVVFARASKRGASSCRRRASVTALPE